MKSLLLCAVTGWALSLPQDIGWLKLDQAKAIGSHTGKLILVYVACDPKSGSAPCNGGVAERAFSEPSILKRQEDFHFVRVCEKKTAQTVKATKPPEAIFLDSDGDEIYRSAFIDGSSLERAMGTAIQRYAPREVRWGSDMPPSTNTKQLVVVGFDDEKGESLKVFEDRTLVKFQDRMEFVRIPVRKDPEIYRKWGVTQLPSVFLCDACKETPEKNILEKLAGRKTASAVKAGIQKALARLHPEK